MNHMQNTIKTTDVVVIGAGAAGMMCAWQSALRGRSVVLLDHSAKIGAKIKISGGGRCNFTNIYAEPKNYISQNPHFMKSALSQYTQWDFLDIVQQSGIAYHEKTLGQQFCDDTSQQIVDLMVKHCRDSGVVIRPNTKITTVARTRPYNETGSFTITTNNGVFQCDSLVIATGGLSLPKIGATPFGYGVAKQFGLTIVSPEPALVPLTFDADFCKTYSTLRGISADAVVSSNGVSFREWLLFTHRGLSGPSILQISSYMNKGDVLQVNLSPDTDIHTLFAQAKKQTPKRQINTVLSTVLASRLSDTIIGQYTSPHTMVGETSDKILTALSNHVHQWQIVPTGTEGYKVAEVTRGGVNTDHLSSKTMMCKTVQGLFFIGEVVDVTGWLGGYNFQWAWSSGYVAGQNT